MTSFRAPPPPEHKGKGNRISNSILLVYLEQSTTVLVLAGLFTLTSKPSTMYVSMPSIKYAPEYCTKQKGNTTTFI